MRTPPLILAVTLAAIALLAGCSGSNEDAKLRGQYIKGCMSSDIEKEVCTCAYDKLEAHYGKEKLRYINQHPTEIPADFDSVGLNSMLVCSGKPPIPAAADTPAGASPTGDKDVSTLNSPDDHAADDLSPGARAIYAKEKAGNTSAP